MARQVERTYRGRTRSAPGGARPRIEERRDRGAAKVAISGESWAVESGEEHLRGQERAVRAVFEELDFQVYGVDRSGRGARGVPPVAGRTAVADSDALSDYEMLGDEVSWFEVRSGDWSSLDGPYVTVRTYQPGIERYTAMPEPEELIERERDRIYEYLGLDEGDCPSRIRTLREWINVDGEPVPVQIHEERGSGPGAGGHPAPCGPGG